ncbi:uncharacterized protein METZ01_LOCUS207405 [marine metagenome]|uniref:Uncharacterized protein n=1 Tax=marine metagenome TaxID=408172 RepID=A0A382EX84_9ZZZZ
MSEFIDIAIGLLIIEMMAILFQVLGVIVLASVVAIFRVMTRFLSLRNGLRIRNLPDTHPP